METHLQTFITGVAHCTLSSFMANLLSMFEAKLLAENTLFIEIQFIYAHYFQRRANWVPIVSDMLQSLCKPPVSLTLLILFKLIVADMEMGCCLGPERNGVNIGGGGEGGPGPPERRTEKQLMPSKGGDNMEKDEEEQPNRMYWRRVGVNRVSGHFMGLNSYKCNCRYPDSDHCFFFLSGE
jgi:hypothetical protein